ncbi:gamma-butyrobetaine hydroxylase-like domain-containing protein [Marinobacter segnicrescens]|uniref:gamma-butyrobetaine hydroxylase-like domain-containing protein n=1 Tax=Marinobacter segnicrescens TaxID=430453 RepID=UPI003A8F4C87
MSQRPSAIRIRKQSRLLQLDYDDGTRLELPFEFLRVWSPSAEVRGHGAGPGTLQTGKKDVMVTGAEMVGNYALKLSFSDGHDSGLFTWDYLRDLGENQQAYWEDYLKRLEAEGGSRETSGPQLFGGPTSH